MSSTKEQRVSSPLTSELAVDERERRLQRRWEREKACHDSETAEQREERLRKQRMRDRAKRAAQTTQQRESCLRGIIRMRIANVLCKFRLTPNMPSNISIIKFIVCASCGNMSCMTLYLSIYPSWYDGRAAKEPTSVSNYILYCYNPIGSSTAVLSTATGTGGAAYGISVNNSCSAGCSSTNPTIKYSSVLVSLHMSSLSLLCLCCHASCLLKTLWTVPFDILRFPSK